jgi:hypothetical protein
MTAHNFVSNHKITIFLLIASILHLGCIERNNPWDPINGCPAPVKEELRVKYNLQIDSITKKIQALYTDVDSIFDHFDSTRLQNDIIREKNARYKKQLDSVIAFNTVVDTLFLSINTCDSIRSKKTIADADTLHPLYLLNGTELVLFLIANSENEQNKIQPLIDRGNQECLPHGIYDQQTIDSIFKTISEIIYPIDSINIYNNSILNTNDTISTLLNPQIHTQNQLADLFNKSLEEKKIYCGKPLVSDPESLKTRFSSLTPGDTLFLDSITFGFTIDNVDSIGQNNDSAIVIYGSPFMNTIIKSNFTVSSSSNIRFHNIVFSGSGVKVQASCNNILFENCIFKNSTGHGLEIIESDVLVSNCKIYYNKLDGIRITTDFLNKNTLTVENVLLAHNSRHGISGVSAYLSITNATISDNGKDGFLLEVTKFPINIVRSLITYNTGFGIRNDKDIKAPQVFFATPNSSFFENTSGPIDSNYIEMIRPISNENPFYVDKDSDNYEIGKQSRLYGEGIGYKE